MIIRNTNEKQSEYPFKLLLECPICKRTTSLIMSMQELAAYRQYTSEKETLENLFPKLDQASLEFLRSQYCPVCQEKLHGKQSYENERLCME